MTTLPKYLTQDELKRFFAAITSPRDKALFGLISHDGLRVGEAPMLTVDDVHFTNHRITMCGTDVHLMAECQEVLRPFRRIRSRKDMRDVHQQIDIAVT